MRRVLVTLCAVLLVAACTAEKQAKVETDLSKRLSPGCYTVDLFDPYLIEYPTAGVPPEYAKFLGVWQNGAWGGHWCHDLYITKVEADGTVQLLDAHGPDAARGTAGSVFRRSGRIEDGALKFLSYGYEPVSYRLVGDYLVGERKGKLGTFEITMSRTDGLAQVPVPAARPGGKS